MPRRLDADVEPDGGGGDDEPPEGEDETTES